MGYAAALSTVQFQSSPPHKGRPLGERRGRRCTQFQSSPPHKGRRKFCIDVFRFRHFNPRPHTKGDGMAPRLETKMSTFQSSPPHKGRRMGYAAALSTVQFQSSPPHKGRLVSSPPIKLVRVFQSSPPHKGRLHRPGETHPSGRISILAPTQRATQLALAAQAVGIFQSSPPHKGRLGWLIFTFSLRNFNPRPHTKGDSSSSNQRMPI